MAWRREKWGTGWYCWSIWSRCCYFVFCPFFWGSSSFFSLLPMRFYSSSPLSPPYRNEHVSFKTHWSCTLSWAQKRIKGSRGRDHDSTFVQSLFIMWQRFFRILSNPQPPLWSWFGKDGPGWWQCSWSLMNSTHERAHPWLRGRMRVLLKKSKMGLEKQDADGLSLCS